MPEFPDPLYKSFAMLLWVFLSIAAGVIAFFLKDLRFQMREKEKAQDTAIDRLEGDLADFKASLPRNYVLRDDFIRTMATFDHKIDGMARDISEVNKNVSKLLGGQSRESPQ